jgi:predicted ester cyclase
MGLHPHQTEHPMKRTLAIAALSAALVIELGEVGSKESVPAAVASFYEALSGASGGNVVELLTQATAPDWVSCGANDICRGRAEIFAAILQRREAIPNLKWEIREIVVAGDRVIVRGEATGTPTGDFMGVRFGGKSFKLMSIDMHTIDNGKLVRSYHVEDWVGAIRQLSAN